MTPRSTDPQGDLTTGRVAGRVAVLPWLIWILGVPAAADAGATGPAERAVPASAPADRLGPRISEAELFAGLDLELPSLAEVREDLRSGDPDRCRRALAAHFRRRSWPTWAEPDPPPAATQPADTARLLKRADRFARNELVSVEIWHDFGEVIDWSANPSPNRIREWTWQLNRHGFWRELARAYQQTGDERYARAFARQMTDWIRSSPVPLDRPDQGPGSRWRTIEAGIRMGQSWPEAFEVFRHSPSVGDDDLLLMVRSFVDHAHYLLAFPTGGNWLMMEACGLYHVGALFPEFRASAGWRAAGMGRLHEQLEQQVYPDGAHNELSTGYHQAALKNPEWALRLARRNGFPVPDGFLERMERLCDFNLYLVRPDWRLPSLNDGVELDIRAYMGNAFELFPRRRDYLFAATGGTEGDRPARTSYSFPYAGLLVMRSGWDPAARYGLLEVGPFGAGHQHEDKLNFIIHAWGRYLLIDPGNYPYDDSPWRQYIYRSWAHNVLHIDGMEQYRRGLSRDHYVVSEPLPHAWVTTAAWDYAAGSYGIRPEEGYSADRLLPAVWTRHVFFVKDPPEAGRQARDYWLVIDELAPTDDRPHRYEFMFHLDADEVVVDPADRRIRTVNREAANLTILPAAEAPLEIRVVRGQVEPVVQGWAPAGGYDMRPIPTVIIEMTVAGPARLACVFSPAPPGAVSPVAGLRPRRDSADLWEDQVIFTDGRSDTLRVRPSPQVSRP